MTGLEKIIGGHYQLTGWIGRGGMAIVHRAIDLKLGRQVAVKEAVPPSDMSRADRDIMFERLAREAQLAASLKHPNIIAIHAIVHENGRPWIVMELIEAPNIAEIIDNGPLPPAQTAAIGIQMLDALATAHEAGIVHRDVKPSNIMLTSEGRAILTDFGIAVAAHNTPLTQTGGFIGSPGYMAPERIRGQKAVAASDLWALGATLFMMVEGRHPYADYPGISVMQAILTEPPAPCERAGPLRPVIEGLLHPDPDERLTVQQAKEILRVVAGTTVVPKIQPPTRPAAPLAQPKQPEPRPQPSWADQHMGVLIPGALAVMMAVVIGAYVLAVHNHWTIAGSAPRPHPTTSAPPTPSPSPSLTPPSEQYTIRPTTDSDYDAYSDPNFTVRIPHGWSVNRGSTGNVDFTELYGRHRLSAEMLSAKSLPAAIHATQAAHKASGSSSQPEDLHYGGSGSSRWVEWSYIDCEFPGSICVGSLERLQIRLEPFKSHYIKLYMYALNEEWPAGRSQYNTFVRTFHAL